MASADRNAGAPRPSWSKIAASGYIPPESKTSLSKSPAVSTDAQQASLQSQSAARKDALDRDLQEGPSFGERRGPAAPISRGTEVMSKVASAKSIEAALKATSNDDGSTQTSSDDSAKPFSFDTKSVTSAATFAMDEKESLRPDDSASMRAAIEEEDLISAPGSVIAGSRVGSDFGAKPFREQLQEIPYIVATQARGASGSLYLPSASLGASISGSPAPIPTNDGSQPPETHVMQVGATMASTPPDEKLVDALQSQRDRVWVLKLEQDIIDFVGQSKETSLTLPQCNAFYRMLAHKLADYYKLDHAVAQTGTGAAVVISKTSFARIPPPLSGIAIASNVAETPPLLATARKIMRRAGDPRSEATTAADSEGPSASVSEVGIDLSAADASSNSKAKAQLTREEREKQYAEARERIFGKSSLSDINDDNVIPDEAGQSRSSSAADKQQNNNNRRQRNLSDDDFEPRSQFPAYYTNPTYAAASGLPQGPQIYAQAAGANANQPYAAHQMVDPASEYGIGSHAQNTSWAGQFYRTAPPSGFEQGSAQGYDMSAHMQNAMQLQPGSVNGQNSVGYGHVPYGQAYATMALPTSPQPLIPAWQHTSLQFNQGYNPQSFGAYLGQSEQMQSQFGYSGIAHGQQMNEYQQMHPQPFNPQTQAFIPSMPASPYQQISPMPNQYQQFGAIGQSPSPSYALAPTFSSAAPGLSPRPQDTFASFLAPSGPGAHNSRTPHLQDQRARNKQRLNTGQVSHASSGVGASSLEITAKFGMPAHLPARPPPPQSVDQHRGAAGVPRMSPTGPAASNKSSKQASLSPIRDGPASQKQQS